MKYLSVCSGIEAATVAWHGLGWEPAAFAEIEAFPSAVLKHHYPDVPNVGDMTNFKEWDIGAIRLLVGGTPCQAFSVAGLRGGLSDARGNLSLTFCEIADHYDPEWVVWENVPGVLSSKDNAFGCFLAGLCGAGEPLVAERGWQNAGLVSGPKRTVAWRILDAQFFGLAQRRRRIFVLACRGPGNWACARALFPLGEGLFWDSAPRRQARKEIAGTIIKSTYSGGASGKPDGAAGNHFIGVMAGQTMRGEDVFPCLDSTSYEKGWCDQAVHQGLGVFCLSSGQANAELTIDHAPTLNCLHEAPVAFPSTLFGTQYASTENLSPAMGFKNPTAVAFDTTQITSPSNYSNPRPGDPCHPLAAGAHPPAVAFRDTADCLTSAYGTKWNGNASADNGSLFAAQAMQVRRLTPRECERLQGFPDDYTDIAWRGKPATECPDGPRYKALGNSMAVPVMRWIGRRIQLVEDHKI